MLIIVRAQSCFVSVETYVIRGYTLLTKKVFEREDIAVLYTGDTRSEPWFVNALARNPCLIEYTSGIKTLDKIYLDTSNIEDIHFQTKAEGLQELLRKVSKYPNDTIFHFQAWTYGYVSLDTYMVRVADLITRYEDVWIALAKALNTKVGTINYVFTLVELLLSYLRFMSMLINWGFTTHWS